jgi:hypothetical protein
MCQAAAEVHASRAIANADKQSLSASKYVAEGKRLGSCRQQALVEELEQRTIIHGFLLDAVRQTKLKTTSESVVTDHQVSDRCPTGKRELCPQRLTLLEVTLPPATART